MPDPRTTICLLDDRHWRRHAFAASLASLRLHSRTESMAATSADISAFDHDGNLIMIVLGPDELGSDTGETTIARIAKRMTRAGLVVVVDSMSHHCVATALRLGVRGILETSMDIPILEATLQFLAAGGTYIPHPKGHTGSAQDPVGYLPPPDTATAEAVPPAPPAVDKADDDIPDLTRRQRDVALALANGASNKEIARALDVSEATVKSHVRQIMLKFDASNRTQAALKAQAFAGLAAQGHWTHDQIGKAG